VGRAISNAREEKGGWQEESRNTKKPKNYQRSKPLRGGGGGEVSLMRDKHVPFVKCI
jgi:hypothetical protein